jgi:hypothetical protein
MTDRRRKPHPAATSRAVAGWFGTSAMLAMIGGFIQADRSQPPPAVLGQDPTIVATGGAVAPATPATTVAPGSTTVPIQTVGITQRTVVVSPVARTNASR